MTDALQIEKVVTSGTFSLDGGTWEVDNNVWLLGDASTVTVIDPAHDLAAISQRIGQRRVERIVLTHAHDDHCAHAVAAAEQWDAPIYLHSADMPLWELVHPDHQPDVDLAVVETIDVGPCRLQVLHTPGHSPGSICLYTPDIEDGVLFSGDTLFQGGPGATGRSWSDFDTIIASIRDQLLVLPDATQVLPGHGDSTTIGKEAPHLAEWIARGY